jgi:hypothetical protein
MQLPKTATLYNILLPKQVTGPEKTSNDHLNFSQMTWQLEKEIKQAWPGRILTLV